VMARGLAEMDWDDITETDAKPAVLVLALIFAIKFALG
jgi:hypothetical protein